MEKKIRKLLGTISTASLVVAGSIPLMSQTGGGSTGGGDKPQTAKDSPKSTIRDTKGKGGTKSIDQPNVKDTKGKGGCGSTKTVETKTKSK